MSTSVIVKLCVWTPALPVTVISYVPGGVAIGSNDKYAVSQSPPFAHSCVGFTASLRLLYMPAVVAGGGFANVHVMVLHGPLPTAKSDPPIDASVPATTVGSSQVGE